MVRNQSVHCAIGEYAVLAELLRHRATAFLAQGPNQKSWDIMVLESPSEAISKIQVKAISWPRLTAVNGRFDVDDYDYLVIVLLNLPEDRISEKRIRYLVFSKEEAISICSTENASRRDHSRTITIPRKLELKEFFLSAEDNWGKIVRGH